jgi:hypothetical protein
MSALPWPPSAYYWNLMYIGLRTSDALRKKTWRIGSGPGGTSENPQKAKFAEYLFHALR